MNETDRDIKFHKGMVKILEARKKLKMRWWWLSFADKKGFRGVSIVQGRDIVEASQHAYDLKCNPGGEVMGVVIDISKVSKKFKNRLLTSKKEALQIHEGLKK